MINQKDLAKLVGCTAEHLNAIMNGRSNAGVKLARKIADKTGTEPSVWVFGTVKDRKGWRKKLKHGA